MLQAPQPVGLQYQQPPIYRPVPQPVRYKPTIIMLLMVGSIAVQGYLVLTALNIFWGPSSRGGTFVSQDGLTTSLPDTDWAPLDTDVRDNPGWVKYAWQKSSGDYLFSVASRPSKGTISNVTADVLRASSGVASNCTGAPTCVQSSVVWHDMPATRLETVISSADMLPGAPHTVAYIFQLGGSDYNKRI